VGEVIASYRQYLKRFSYVGSITPSALPALTTSPGSSGNGFVLYPWQPVRPQVGDFTVSAAGAMTPTYANNNSALGASISTVCDLYSQVYSQYAFFRGSMRYKLVITQPSAAFNSSKPISVFINMYNSPTTDFYSPNMAINTNAAANNLGTGPIQILYDLPQVSTTTLKTNFTYQPGFVEHNLVVFPDKEGVVEFEVPFLATGHMVPTTYGLNNQSKARSIVYPLPTVTIYSGGNGGLVDCAIDVYRAIGDDFSFGSLIGVPKHALWQSAINPA